MKKATYHNLSRMLQSIYGAEQADTRTVAQFLYHKDFIQDRYNIDNQFGKILIADTMQRQKEFTASGKHRIISREELEYPNTFTNIHFQRLVWRSVTSYGRMFKSEYAQHGHYLVFDIDTADTQELARLLNSPQAHLFNVVCPSGSGLHVYIALDTPITITGDNDFVLYTMNGFVSHVYNVFEKLLNTKLDKLPWIQSITVPGCPVKESYGNGFVNAFILNRNKHSIQEVVDCFGYHLKEQDLARLAETDREPYTKQATMQRTTSDRWVYDRRHGKARLKGNQENYTEANFDLIVEHCIQYPSSIEGQRWLHLDRLTQMGFIANVSKEKIVESCYRIIQAWNQHSNSDNQFTRKEVLDVCKKNETRPNDWLRLETLFKSTPVCLECITQNNLIIKRDRKAEVIRRQEKEQQKQEGANSNKLPAPQIVTFKRGELYSTRVKAEMENLFHLFTKKVTILAMTKHDMYNAWKSFCLSARGKYNRNQYGTSWLFNKIRARVSTGHRLPNDLKSFTQKITMIESLVTNNLDKCFAYSHILSVKKISKERKIYDAVQVIAKQLPLEMAYFSQKLTESVGPYLKNNEEYNLKVHNFCREIIYEYYRGYDYMDNYIPTDQDGLVNYIFMCLQENRREDLWVLFAACLADYDLFLLDNVATLREREKKEERAKVRPVGFNQEKFWRYQNILKPFDLIFAYKHKELHENRTTQKSYGVIAYRKDLEIEQREKSILSKAIHTAKLFLSKKPDYFVSIENGRYILSKQRMNSLLDKFEINNYRCMKSLKNSLSKIYQDFFDIMVSKDFRDISDYSKHHDYTMVSNKGGIPMLMNIFRKRLEATTKVLSNEVEKTDFVKHTPHNTWHLENGGKPTSTELKNLPNALQRFLEKTLGSVDFNTFPAISTT